MFVKGAGKIHTEQLLMIQGQRHSATGKLEVAEMIWVDIRMTVRLKGGTYNVHVHGEDKVNNSILVIIVYYNTYTTLHTLLCWHDDIIIIVYEIPR